MSADTPHAWLDPAAVSTHLGTAAGQADVELARVAAAAYVERARPDLWHKADGAALTWDQAPGTWDQAGGTWAQPDVGVTYSPTADVIAGAMLLTSRLHSRKGSPGGIASFGEFGPSPVLRVDPDVERLLGLGRYARPRVG